MCVFVCYGYQFIVSMCGNCNGSTSISSQDCTIFTGSKVNGNTSMPSQDSTIFTGDTVNGDTSMPSQDKPESLNTKLNSLAGEVNQQHSEYWRPCMVLVFLCM